MHVKYQQYYKTTVAICMYRYIQPIIHPKGSCHACLYGCKYTAQLHSYLCNPEAVQLANFIFLQTNVPPLQLAFRCFYASVLCVLCVHIYCSLVILTKFCMLQKLLRVFCILISIYCMKEWPCKILEIHSQFSPM